MYSGIKHIFFDLDDTLWDFEKNSSIVLRELFDEFSLNTKLNAPFDEFYHTYKQVNNDLWSRYNKGHITKQHLRDHRFNETFKKFNYSNYQENLSLTGEYLCRAPHGRHLKDGCLETLAYLKERYSLHIITNGFKEVQHIKIDNCGLRNYFSNIIISEEHQLSKPDRMIFRLSEKLAGGNSAECVMIGDNYESDIEGAHGAGWQAIFFSPTSPPGNCRQVQSLQELTLLF